MWKKKEETKREYSKCSQRYLMCWAYFLSFYYSEINLPSNENTELEKTIANNVSKHIKIAGFFIKPKSCLFKKKP